MTNASETSFFYHTDEQGNTFIQTRFPVSLVDDRGTVILASAAPNQPRVPCGVVTHTHRADRKSLWQRAVDPLAAVSTGFLFFCSAELVYWIAKAAINGLIGLAR